MLAVDFEIVISGPLFNGEAAAAVQDFCDALEYELGDEGVRLIHEHLRTVLRHPTGNYDRHIRDRSTTRGQAITDSRMVYGPWLEGTGERNRSTRFKGYSTFRIAAGQLDRQAVYYAERIATPYVHRMGG